MLVLHDPALHLCALALQNYSVESAVSRQPLHATLASETAFLVAAAIHFDLCLLCFSSQRAKDDWLSPDGLPRTNPSTLMSSSKSGQ